MNDLSDLVPLIAAHVGINPATLVFYLFVLHRIAIWLSRRIPNDAIGWLSVVGKVASIIAVDPSARITSGVSVQDVATQALTVPPIPQAVAAEKGVPVVDVLPTKG